MHTHTGDCTCNTTHAPDSRRRFLKIAALGGGAMLLGVPALREARAAGGIEALLLNCMDYRLTDDTTRYMDGRGLTNNYDQIILAGAGLGALTEQKPDWNQTFWDHIDVAKQLHNIKRVIVMDHRDCGAYKVFLGLDLKDDPVKETAVHTEILVKLGGMIREKHPDLEVELLLMALDGSVQKIG
ncbi:carbonic anhydrase [Azospirillum halopraeferens]|uniref:carbonic anhydrase n=1 Tax=Azospirillum halopraeferens TaxID=34010 RepID=UPI0003FF5170|nr:carbonic anhydrase [Azospirillum halopraeferens]